MTDPTPKKTGSPKHVICPAPERTKVFLKDITFPRKIYSTMKDKIKEQKRVMIIIKMEGNDGKAFLVDNVDEYAKILPKTKEVFETYKTESEIPFLIMERPHMIIQIYQIDKLIG